MRKSKSASQFLSSSGSIRHLFTNSEYRVYLFTVFWGAAVHFIGPTTCTIIAVTFVVGFLLGAHVESRMKTPEYLDGEANTAESRVHLKRKRTSPEKSKQERKRKSDAQTDATKTHT